jgi:TonB-linked SusC/RagA family outer membrane protein
LYTVKQIFMKIAIALSAFFLVWISVASAQVQLVRGVVVSEEDGQPVVGATVLVKGTSIGATTGKDGGFLLQNLPASAATLRISFIGMVTQEVGVASEVKITLRSDALELEQVVVTGMQRVDKRLFTGATDQLKADEVKLDGIPDVSRALEGRSAGVSVQNVAGAFGTAPKIRVRGATSIYGSSKPLWVVDGVVVEDVVELNAEDLSSGDAVTLISSAVAGLNADDIESFQILKDGSATSIYGARAMAGVIVITTKKGKAGVSRISYTGEYTMRLKPRYADFNIMNSQEQMGVYVELQNKGWLNFSDTYRASESGVFGKMYQLMNTYHPATGSFALLNTPEAEAGYLREAELRNTDWFDLLFENTLMHSHAVSLASGTEKASHYASLSVLSDPGWTKQSEVSRYTANLNTSYNVLESLSLNLISSASYRRQKAPGTLNRGVDPVYGEVRRDFDINPYSYALNTSRTLDANEFYTRSYAPFNIFHELENNYIDLNVVDLKFQGEMKWKPAGGVEVSVLGAIKHQATSQERVAKEGSNQAEAYRAMGDASIRDQNPLLYTDPDNPYSWPISILPEGGIFQKTDYKLAGYDFRASVLWNKAYNNTHIINFFGGTEVNSIDRNRTWFNGWGMQYSMGEIPFYTYQFFKKSVETGSSYYSLSNSHSRSASFFANATYSYRGRYTVNGTARYEGANKLGKATAARWLPTWNLSGAWNVHEEAFFGELKSTLSHLTVKASYSLTADRGPAEVTNSFVVFNSYKPYRPFSGVQESGIEIYDLENSELTYEKKHELNVGADVGLLSNRINLNADLYWRNNFDLIGIINTQGVGGQLTKAANVAAMKSSGVELTLSTQNVALRDFSWSSDVIFSHFKNEVTKFDAKPRVVDLVTGSGFTREGYPVRGLFSIPFAGLNEEGLPTFVNQNGELTVTDIDFQERDNVDFLKYAGPIDPSVVGSFGNIFRYKNFRLNIFITYSFGNKVRLDPVFSSAYSDLTASPKEFANRWVNAGDEQVTNIPVIISRRQSYENSYYKTAYNAYNYSDARIADGGFARMKEISLSYDFPAGWIEGIKLSALSLKVQATNLFLIYADKKLNGQDPEFFRSGGVAVPVPKQLTFTLRMSL